MMNAEFTTELIYTNDNYLLRLGKASESITPCVSQIFIYIARFQAKIDMI